MVILTKLFLQCFHVWVFTDHPPTHTHSPPQMVHEASEHQLGCEGRAQPISLPSHTQAEILLVRCGGDRQSRNTNEYCSHLLPLQLTVICYNFLLGSKHKISSQQNSWRINIIKELYKHQTGLTVMTHTMILKPRIIPRISNPKMSNPIMSTMHVPECLKCDNQGNYH